MNFFMRANYRGGQGSQPSYTNWWQGMGDVVPESTNYTVYDPLAAADLAASYVNLANPGTRNASLGVAPTHAQGTGWTFDGLTQYLKSGTAAKDIQTTIIWVENAAGVYAIGSFTSTGGVREQWIRPVNSTTTSFRRQGVTRGMQGATRGGILGISRNTPYKNGMADTNELAAWVGADGREMFIGCQNSDGTANNFFSGDVRRVAIFDIALTADQYEAVVQAMFDYNQAEDNAYSSIVIASNPICYYSCNHTTGSVLFDKSGNKAHGESYFLPVGQAGMSKGNSIAGDGNANNSVKTCGEWATATGFNMDEFSAAVWFKVTSDATNQVRVFNIYSNAGNEYAAAEVRSGLNLQIFFKENGVTYSSPTLKVLTSGVEHHIVFYNSKSNGVHGVYVDGVKYETSRTLSGFVDTSPDETYPLVGQDLSGNFNHISYYDHMLSQSEVNALYVP